MHERGGGSAEHERMQSRTWQGSRKHGKARQAVVVTTTADSEAVREVMLGWDGDAAGLAMVTRMHEAASFYS
jgi:hypothetical protein